MKGVVPPTISIKRVRKLLGTHAKGLSDKQLFMLINQVEQLTDIVIDLYDGSKNQAGLVINPLPVHTREDNE